MIKLGVAGLLPAWQCITAEDCRRVHATGFKGAQWFIPDPLHAEQTDILRVKESFRSANLEICQMNGSYRSLVSRDEIHREEGIEGIQALTRIGACVGAYCVYIRPGGLNPHGDWYAHPDNKAPATFERLVDSVRKACRTAETEGALLAIEGHVLSPLYSVERVCDLFEAVASPALRFNADPVNFLGTLEDVFDNSARLKKLFDQLGKYTVAAHAKDVTIQDRLVLHIDETLLGTGALEYEVFLREFQHWQPDGYMLIEHLPDEKVPEARANLVRIANNIGIGLDCD